MAMAQTPRFKRGLSDRFIQALLGIPLGPLYRRICCESLDVQIRDRYLDVYAQGRCVLQLQERKGGACYFARIHHKFLAGVDMPAGMSTGQYRLFPVTATFIDGYIQGLPMILENARRYAKPEGIAEEAILQASLQPGSPIMFLDRQVAVPGIRIKADALGWQPENGGGRMILVELKQGLDNRIQELMTQMESYASVMAADGVLRDDLSTSYRAVLAQKQALGLLPQSLILPSGPLPVDCLFILYDYNLRSALLDRMRATAKHSPLRTQLILLPKDTYSMPPATEWETL